MGEPALQNAPDATSPGPASAAGGIAGPSFGLVGICARHWLIMLLSLAASGALGIGYLLYAPPLYTSVARIHVTASRPRILNDAEPAPTGDDFVTFLHAQRAVITSMPVLQEAVQRRGLDRLDSLRGVGDAVRYLKQRIRVSVGRKDGIISAEFDAPVARDAAEVVNAVVDAYVANQAAQQQGMATELLRILGDDKARCEGLIAEKRQQMLALRKAAAAPSLDLRDDSGGVLRTLQSLKEALIVARMEAAAAEAAYSEAYAAYRADPEVEQLIREMERSGTAVSDPDAAQMRASIADLDQRVQELMRSKQCLPSHPEVRAHKTRLDYLKASYVVGLSRKAAAAAARQHRLEAAVRDQETLARDLADKADTHARLDAELRQLERHLELVDGRMKEIQAVRAAGPINVRVIEPAVPEPLPEKPSRTQVMAMALAAGLVLGSVLAAIREATDHRLRTVEQVRALLGLPVLGIVPRIRRRQRAQRVQILRVDPLAPASEAFRAIRAAVCCGRQPAQSGLRVLLASVSSNEGTSLVVSNLGVALAQAGFRTLIVDANFRSPSQHVNLGTGSGAGLSGVLAGDVPVASAIQRTAIEGLDVIPAGSPAVAAPEVLAGERLEALLRELSGKYHILLLDAPPVAEYADARLLAGLCDAALLVVRLGRTDGRLAAQACDGLRNIAATLLGVVINAGRCSRKRAWGCFDAPRAQRGRAVERSTADAAQGAASGPSGAAVGLELGGR